MSSRLTRDEKIKRMVTLATEMKIKQAINRLDFETALNTARNFPHHLRMAEGFLTEKLYDAVLKKDIQSVRAMLEMGADPNLSLAGQADPLTKAIGTGDITIVKTLIDNGADVNSKTPQGFIGNPILGAIQINNPNIVRTLARSGADLNAPFTDGSSGAPLEVAIHNNKFEIVKTLVEEGADINVGGALLVAIDNKNIPVALFLLNSGARFEATPFAFMVALIEKLTPVVNKFIEIYGENIYDYSFVHSLLENRQDFIKVLLDTGKVDVNNALLYASRIGATRVVQLLIALGANPNTGMLVRTLSRKKVKKRTKRKCT